MKFDDNYRASVVVMLQAEGYPQDEFALGRVHKYLAQKAPYPTKTTISNWFRGIKNPPPSTIVDNKKDSMVDALEAIAWQLIGHVTQADIISEMSGQQAITSIAILVDKIQLLKGEATAINENRNATIIFKTGMSLDAL